MRQWLDVGVRAGACLFLLALTAREEARDLRRKLRRRKA